MNEDRLNTRNAYQNDLSGAPARKSRSYRSEPVGPSPPPTSRAVSRVMKSNRASGTGLEVIMSRALRKKIMRNNLPGHPDFAYRREKVAVFVHGCFWHRCPVHAKGLPKTHASFWRRKFKRNVERDRLIKTELEGMGWCVLIVWEHELKETPQACAIRVKAAVEGRRHPSPE